MLLAAFAVNDTATADTLLPPTMAVLDELQRVDLLKRVVSLAPDGAATERKLQDLVAQRHSRELSIIRSANAAFKDVAIEYAMIGGTRVVFVIDEKHTSKNAVNAHATGARILTVGDRVITFGQLLSIIEGPGSPLFKRDVLRRDRQDDQAMERYLSAESIAHVVKSTPDQLGFIVYLYIFGEMHSAVQSRSLPHTKRAEMLLTLEYFLQGWEFFIMKHPDYGAQNFLPVDFVKIVRRLTKACLGLIYIFRDYHGPGRRGEPLLPWRHMTEAIEHFFGTVRRNVQEFDIVEFANIAKKALTLMDLETKIAATGLTSDAEPRARRGYQHTHHLGFGIDLENLSTFPDDVQMGDIALQVSWVDTVRLGSRGI